MPYLTHKARLCGAPERFAILRDAMLSATKVYNGLIFHLRQEYEQQGKVCYSASYLNRIARGLPRHKELYSDVVDTTRQAVGWALGSFFQKHKRDKKARPPGFRKKTRLSPLRYSHPNNGSIKVIHKRGMTYLRISLGTTRQDGVRRLVFRLHTRPNVDLSQLKNVQIIYDTHTRDFQARLVVEVDVPDKPGEATVGVDIGEDWLIAADFCDGSRYLVCGRMLKATRRYWQKVRAKVKPPSQDHPKMSRRYRQIARKEARQITHALHIASRRFVDVCVDKGVGTIILGDLTGIRQRIAYGKRMNQRLHAWPYDRLSAMIEYKAALLGIKVKVVCEKYTSQTCPHCGIRKKSNRKHRGWYSCCCGFEGHADLVGAFNIHQKVSGVPSSGRSARPVVLVFDHHTVHEAASSREAA